MSGTSPLQPTAGLASQRVAADATERWRYWIEELEGEMQFILRKSVALILLVSVSGCSFFAPRTQELSARCSEPDAALFIEKEKFIGEGTARVKRNSHVNIMCTKPGFKPAIGKSTVTLSGTGLADAVGGMFILLPGIGLLSPGAWRHQSDNVNVPMEREVNLN